MAFTLSLSGFISPAYQDPQPEVIITSPLPGSALQGQVTITGSAAHKNFLSYELQFGYINDPTSTWFLISSSNIPLTNGPLAEWNTFGITDGNYTLRLRVNLRDGTTLESRIDLVRVRNYQLIETSTPTPTLTLTPSPTPDRTRNFVPTSTGTTTPTVTPSPTLTPLPTNPAQLTATGITSSAIRGVSGILVIFLSLGIYTTLRKRR